MRPLKIFLGHGASGGVESIRPHVEGLRARGFEAGAVALPIRRAEAAVKNFLDTSGEGAGIVVGGHSYGGRVASLAAARHRFAALLCFSYPLHPPGRPEKMRTEHLVEIRCPALFLSGDADQFAQIDRLRDAVDAMHQARLLVFKGESHGIRGALDQALDASADFLRGLQP